MARAVNARVAMACALALAGCATLVSPDQRYAHAIEQGMRAMDARRADEIFAAALGPEHPDTATAARYLEQVRRGEQRHP